MKKLDLQRCRLAIQAVKVAGVCGESKQRQKAMEDALTAFYMHGDGALLTEYIGVKNYASFGDQREDHSYGMKPRHGSIVFSIQRVKARGDRLPTFVPLTDELLADVVYYLQCERDFSALTISSKELPTCANCRTFVAYDVTLNLCKTLELLHEYTDVCDQLGHALLAAEVDAIEISREWVE